MQRLKKMERRKKRVKAKIFGTKSRPRLSVFRSNRFIYAQLIDDERGITLLSASDKNLDVANGTKTERAKLLGKFLAEASKKKKISEAIFDRNRYRYHGRLKALAEAIREAGLTI